MYLTGPEKRHRFRSREHREQEHEKAKFFSNRAFRASQSKLTSTYGMQSSCPFFTKQTVSTTTHACASNLCAQFGLQSWLKLAADGYTPIPTGACPPVGFFDSVAFGAGVPFFFFVAAPFNASSPSTEHVHATLASAAVVISNPLSCSLPSNEV